MSERIIETNLARRWESGTPHHHRSADLVKSLADLDFRFGGDYFSFKIGGDGDNGEHLMYLMDIINESQDAVNAGLIPILSEP